jgi:hypothetical protein
MRRLHSFVLAIWLVATFSGLSLVGIGAEQIQPTRRGYGAEIEQGPTDMNWQSTWPVLVGVVAGFVLTGVGPGARLLWRVLRRPRLRVYVERDELTYQLNKNTTLLDGAGGKSVSEGVFVSLAVKNEPLWGCETARDCKARIIGFERIESPDRLVQPSTFVPGTLLWANQGVDDRGNLISEPLDVEAGVPALLGACATYRSEPGVHLLTARKTQSGRQEDFAPGKYVMRVRLYTNEIVRAAEERFIINLTREWDGITIEPFSESALEGPEEEGRDSGAGKVEEQPVEGD